MIYFSDSEIHSKMEKAGLDNNSVQIIEDLDKCNETLLDYEKCIFVKNLLPSKIVCNTGARDLIELMVERGIDIQEFIKENSLRPKSFYYDFYQWMSLEECLVFFTAAQKELGNLNPRSFLDYGKKISSLQNNLHSFFNIIIQAINFKFIYKLVPKMNRTYNKTISIQYITGNRHKDKTIKIILLVKFFQNFIEDFDIKHYFWISGNLLAIPILKDYMKAECTIRYYSYDIFRLLLTDYNYLNLNVVKKNDMIYVNNKKYLKKILLPKEKFKNKSIYGVSGEDLKKGVIPDCHSITCYQVIEDLKDTTHNDFILKKGEIFNLPYNRYEITIDLTSKQKKVNPRSKKALNVYLKKLQEQVIELEKMKTLAQQEAQETKKAKEELYHLNLTLEKRIKERTLELETAKNQIEKNAGKKTALFINLAHETKTPLTLIGNYLDRYIEQYGTSEELEIIKYNIDKLTRNIINFLDAEKIELKKLIYDQKENINLSDYIKNIIELFKNFIIDKKIKIISNIENNIIYYVDPFAIDRILNNLIDNAVHYTKAEGLITISLKKVNTGISIMIEDTGPGIPDEYKKHIFEKYYQISTQKRNIQGIGMGLYITKHIIESLGGTLNLESQVGKGSKFEIILPGTNEKTGKAESNFSITRPRHYTTREIEHKENIKSWKHTVLFVEDNTELLQFLLDAMKEKYNVITAANGIIALEKLQKYKKIDIIVSDIMMDEMDGFRFYDELSGSEEYNKIPFIFLTAKTSVKEKLKGLRKGAVDFISKPFNIKELSAKIESLIKIQYLINLFHDKERFASIGRLVSGIAHQILNPLSGISGPLENFQCNLSKNNLLDDRRKKYFHTIKESAKKIEDIVKSLRILSYPNNREQEVNLFRIFNSIISLYNKEVKSRIKFNINIDNDFTIITSVNDFMNICMNLISNSVDAIENEGEISINCIKDEIDLVIEIIDTGYGIKNEDMDSLFEMDFTTKPMGRGTGIGLYIVKELVSKIKWEITIMSEFGRSTTVSLIKRDYYD